MDGVVIDIFGKWVKIRTQNGETVVKMNRKLPEIGELVRITDHPVNLKVYAAEKIFEAPEVLPPLQKLQPLLRNIDKPRNDADIPFLVKLIERVENRIGQLRSDFFEQVGLYYKNGEVNESLKTFGLWLMTVSHPFTFKSLPDLEKPLHIFMDRNSKRFRIDFVRNSKTMSIEGLIINDQIVLDIKGFKIDQQQIEQLRTSLSTYFKSVLINTGGLRDGLYA